MSPSETENVIWAVTGRPGDDFGIKTFAELNPAPPIGWLSVLDRHETQLLEEYENLLQQTRQNEEDAPPVPLTPLKSLISLADGVHPENDPQKALAHQPFVNNIAVLMGLSGEPRWTC